MEDDAWAVELGLRVGLEAWVDPQTGLMWGREAETRRADGSSDQWGPAGRTLQGLQFKQDQDGGRVRGNGAGGPVFQPGVGDTFAGPIG